MFSTAGTSSLLGHSSVALLPIEQNPRPIPGGTKVRFRWDNDGEEKTTAVSRAGAHFSVGGRHSQASHRAPSIIAIYSSASSTPSSILLHKDMPADPLQLMDSQLMALRSKTSLDRSPPSGMGSDLLSAGVLLLSLSGFILLFLLGFCLFRMFRRDEEAERVHRRRQLQIVLVPKQRGQNRRPSLVHPQQGKGHSPARREQPLIPPSAQKAFPKRIYQIQAEEGYFSCPPSMRQASLESD